MKLSKVPDLTPNKILIGTALVVTAIITVVWTIQQHGLRDNLGDTDDAMRLVLVRDLMHGRGWYDQLVTRLQPPEGVYMHWSRLVDAGIAGVTWLFRPFMSQDNAEYWMRRVWPALWTFPAIGGALAISRRLGGSTAILVMAVIAATNVQIYEQFHPGRIDHHNIQIVMTLIAAACAMGVVDRGRWAIVAGVATGLGLAVGIEAMPFQALIGASYALRAAFDPADAKTARNYGGALLLSTLFFFALETPPSRWGLSFCDALGWNLVAGVVVAGAGLAAFAQWGVRYSRTVRLVMLGVLGVVSAGVYLGLHPGCVRGPFGAVDPRVVPFWFSNIQELLSWPQLLRSQFDTGLPSVTAGVMSAAAAIYLLWRRRKALDQATLLACAATFLATAASYHAFRMQDYVFWLGFPVLATALADLSERWLRGLAIPTVVAAMLISPFAIGQAGDSVAAAINPKLKTVYSAPNRLSCVVRPSYRRLASLPAGVVLSEIDFGPYILAYTPDSVLAAPYHRMSWGILSAHEALDAPPAAAEQKVRALNVAYVVECPAYILRTGPQSFEAGLRKGNVPAWLKPLSAPNEPLQIYQVLPPAKPAVRPTEPRSK
ncbi:MAG TPA: hypothetical protein VG407_18690 [Caulobacteraceae bacterium]|jgi:hypothetical protein|nr:hypothetical protein [Caulobacteraceae bacterium]